MTFKAVRRLPAIYRFLFPAFAFGIADDEGGAPDDTIEGGDADNGAADTLEGGQGGDTLEGGSADDEDEETIAVGIGAEPPPGSEVDDELIDGKPAPQWVKDLRQKARDDAKELRDLRARVAAAPTAQQPAATVAGDKPTMESCDFDATKYEAEYAAWTERKNKADQEARDAKAKADAEAAEWNGKIQAYKDAGAKLKVPDFQDAQDAATAVLTPIQQSIIVNGAAQPALLMYAIGKNPEKLKELSGITDPVRFAFAAAAIEKDIKVVTRKKQIPAPETRLTGNAGTTAAVDGALTRLRAEAERTGDYTKVNAYRTQQRKKAKP